jgi:hypothetical protein
MKELSNIEHKCPAPFLEVLVREPVLGLCAGYENGIWRCNQFAEHLMAWLPQFALDYSEYQALGQHSAYELLKKAAKAMYNTPKFQNRGEVGELLLHAILCQEYKTIPAISKIYFKDSRNDTVKGFDAVHIVAQDEHLELWLGEVKLYKDINSAIQDVIKELEKHTDSNYLRDEFTAIGNKIDDNWPHGEKLKALIHKNTSLDNIFTAISIPILLTYNSETIKSFTQVTEEYKQKIVSEVTQYYVSFDDKRSKKDLPAHLKIFLILFPLHDKDNLVETFDRELQKLQ